MEYPTGAPPFRQLRGLLFHHRCLGITFSCLNFRRLEKLTDFCRGTARFHAKTGRAFARRLIARAFHLYVRVEFVRCVLW